MKKISLLLFVVCIFCKSGKAQCDKNILYTSGKEDFMDGSGKVQKQEQDKVTVEISKTAIIFNHNEDPNDVMKGTIKEFNCNWSEPYKNGKTVIKAELTEGANDVHEAVVTIEGKDGQVTILLELSHMKIKMYTNKYEEKS